MVNFPVYKRCATISPRPVDPDSSLQKAKDSMLTRAFHTNCFPSGSSPYSSHPAVPSPSATSQKSFTPTVTGDAGRMGLLGPPAMQVCKVPTARVITRTDGGRRTSFSTRLRRPSPDPLRELSEIEIILMKRHIPQSFTC